jgi:exopolyphosphatase/guanosine-5'-triphosphate,3'-diphosphate pyrophosphatase
MELLNLCMDSFMVLDIGGGSTELIFVFKDVVVTKSFPIGIVTLTQSYSSLDEIRANIAQEMQEVQKFIFEVYANHGRVKLFLATAGTPTSVASMKLGMNFKTYDKDKINGTVLYHKDLDIEFKKLFAMSKVEKIEAVGEGRDDLIGTGMLIYDSIFIFSGMNESIVVDDGLVEGLLLEG